jgi:hypothetical protein
MAINTYFAEERREDVLILILGIALLIGAGTLFAVTRDSFARAFGITVTLGVLVFGSGALSLLHRDGPHRAGLVKSVESEQSAVALTAESNRIRDVISRYIYYRWAVIALAVLGALLALLVDSGYARGIAVGLALMFAAQTLIDHYSEMRAREYSTQLTASLTATGSR